MDKKRTDWLLVLVMLLGAVGFVLGYIYVECCSESSQQPPVSTVEATRTVDTTVETTLTVVQTAIPTADPTPTAVPTVVPTVVPTEIEGILQILDLSDEQVQIALGDSSDEKMQLLESSELHPNGLLALCIKPLNLEDSTIQNLYEEAFDRIDLTEDQRVQIANLGNPLFSRFLLEDYISLCPEGFLFTHRDPSGTRLGVEGLATICERSDGFDFNDPSVIELFDKAFNRLWLTEEQRVRIAKLGNPLFSRFLLRDCSFFESEALPTICAHSDGFDFKDPSVIELFERTFDYKAWELTAEQKVQIANLRNSLFSMFLLKQDALGSEGLVAICENFDCFEHYNLEEPIEFHKWFNDEVLYCFSASIKELFKEAYDNAVLTDEQKDRIANSPACVLGLL